MSEDERLWAERERALEAVQKLKVAVNDTEAMLAAIEASRVHMSSAADELRAQQTVIKERVNWVIRELDRVRIQIGRTTQPGDSV